MVQFKKYGQILTKKTWAQLEPIDFSGLTQ